MVPNQVFTSTRPYLSFKLGDELFAADVVKVLEILEVPKITKVPKSPAYLRGVINLRGSVLPVIDTRTKFGMPYQSDTINTCIVVLTVRMENENVVLGALVDNVQEVIEISPEQVKPAPSIGLKYRSEFIDGMVKIEEQFLMLLNLDKVFSSDELVSVQEASATVAHP